MQLYGYKSGVIKVTGRGICYCMDCAISDRRNKQCRKRNRKRARRLAKEIIKEQMG